MIKGVIFDFDGVLIDSPKIYFKTMNSFLQKHKLNLSREELSRLIAFSLHQEFDFLKEKYSLGVSFEEFIKGTLFESRKVMEKELQLNHGVIELLKDLRENKLSIGLASNNNRAVVQFVLKKFGLESFFDAVIPVELVVNPKPAPDVYLKCAQVLALNPSECVGIEDTVIGCQAVKNAGLKCIAFPNEFSDKNLFSDVDLSVSSLSELSAKKIISLGGR